MEYKINEVEKLRCNEALAGFVDLDVGSIIRLPPPAIDRLEAENHVFKLGKLVSPFT